MARKDSNKNIEFRIREMLQDRLNKPGVIKTDDAWKICRSEFGYSTIAGVFKRIMEEMRDHKKAEFLQRGQWLITDKMDAVKSNIKPDSHFSRTIFNKAPGNQAPIKRPAPEYTNSKSPYGIADELHSIKTRIIK